MSHPFLNFFIPLISAIVRKGSCQLNIYKGEEEEEKHHWIESGAIVQNRNEIDGVEEEEEEQHDRARKCNYLPEELMIDSILTRLPVRTLAVCCCVCKSWYNSILGDSRFSVVHYIQNKNKLSLVFHLLNVSRDGIGRTCFFNLLERPQKTLTRIRCLAAPNIQGLYELIGFCNGLACLNTHDSISILNPNRGESLVLPYLRPNAGEYIYLCHGFGFDSLSQVYKAVIIFASKTSEFLCMVITLGAMSWRKIHTSTLDISPPPGSSPFPRRMITRASRTLCIQATFCGGDLFWMTKNTVDNNSDEIQMLLSFDLHNEKIKFIRLPAECTPATAAHERQDFVGDHLLDFKGYPCIARSERITRSNNDHSGHRCNYQTGVCCCCYKVNMYILKDRDKQVWTREETFDVQIMGQGGLPPTPLCGYFDTSTPTPPTRILAFSDQVLLYWFNGERLMLYNVQEKHLKVVKCSRTYPTIFQTKMNEDLERCIGDDDNIYCPSMDYQLHAQAENIVSMKAFVPKGAKTIESDCADELMHLVDSNIVAGWLTLGRKKHTFSAFF